MSISDRLDQIEARAETVVGLTLGDDNARDAYNLVDDAVPDLVAALRAVLELHVLQFDRTVDHDGEPGTYCDMCNVGPWPCTTVRVVQAALGEES